MNYPENRFKYNGNELQNKEFIDGSGLELYDFNARMYDQQIGRFLSTDPATELAQDWTGYRFGFDNPVLHNDPTGLWEGTYNRGDAGFDQILSSLRNGSFDINGGTDKNKPDDWVHNKSTGKVYWDANVHSGADLKDKNLEYWGTGGKTYKSSNGEVTLLANGKWGYSNELDRTTLGKNLLGLSYPGGNNPKSYNRLDNFSYAPFFESEYPAIGHDRRYDRLKIRGGAGLFTDTRSIGADMRFVAEELKIGFSFSGRSNGVLDNYNRSSALVLGIGLGIAATPKFMYKMASSGPYNATAHILMWYYYSNIGVSNTPSLSNK